MGHSSKRRTPPCRDCPCSNPLPKQNLRAFPPNPSRFWGRENSLPRPPRIPSRCEGTLGGTYPPMFLPRLIPSASPLACSKRTGNEERKRTFHLNPQIQFSHFASIFN